MSEKQQNFNSKKLKENENNLLNSEKFDKFHKVFLFIFVVIKFPFELRINLKVQMNIRAKVL